MKLEFKKIGKGPVVVILHGLFGMSDNWLSIAKKMADDFCFYLIDQRNHGHSPHLDEMNYAVMADDLHAFCLEQNLSNFSLVGHSMGGKVAMTFASKYTHLIKNLTIVDIAPKAYNSSKFKIFIQAMMDIDLNTLSSRSAAEKQLAQTLNQPAHLIQFLLKNLYRNAERTFSWRINLAAIKTNLELLLGMEKLVTGNAIPTLFIKGALSEYIRENDREIILNYFPKASIKELRGANHWVHATAPEMFIKTLHSFIINK